MNSQKLPSKQEAENILSWGKERNPGVWVEHCRTAARAAEKIAKQCGLDEDTAYVLALLHDIGRFEGKMGARHIYAGFKLMSEKGYDYNAKICLTHSFPVKDTEAALIKNDCSKEETEIIKKKINEYEYDDYDKLIQLCDAICLPEGVCLMEVRLLEVTRRYKVYNEGILNKWEAFFGLKEYFDAKANMNIYNLFYDEIIKNSIK